MRMLVFVGLLIGIAALCAGQPASREVADKVTYQTVCGNLSQGSRTSRMLL